jgi:hypothetical protein
MEATASKTTGAASAATGHGQQTSTGATGSAQGQICAADTPGEEMARSDEEMRDAHGTSGSGTVEFDGASTNVQQPLPLWICTHCGQGYAIASVVAYLQADNSFVKEDNPNFKAAIALAKEGTEPKWSNRFSETTRIAQKLVCVHCCEQLHDTVYTKNGKPTARWGKLRKRSHGSVSKSSTEHILNLVNKQTREGADQLPKVDVKDVFARLEANDAAKKGMDWIEWLGPMCTFHNGCAFCQSFPMQSSSWYRATKKARKVQEGQTTLGETVGYWLCAVDGCLQRWSWKKGGERRLMVIGTEHMILSGEYYFAYVASRNPRCENKITLLKCLTMLQVLGSRAITPQVICMVIDEVNTMTEKKLCKGVKELTTRLSGDVSGFDCYLYCEHKSLSLAKPGFAFKTIGLKGRDDVPTFDDDELSEFLDTLASFMNVDLLSPTGLAPAQRLAQRNILTSPSYLRARTRLQAICGQIDPPDSPSLAGVLRA